MGEPNFAGTVLEFSSSNQNPGQFSIQPLMFLGPYYGSYANDWSLKPTNHYLLVNYQAFGYLGFTKHVQLEFNITSATTAFNGRSTTHLGDSQIGLGFQFLWEERGTPKPNLRFVVLETIPTGAFQNLDPHFMSNDATGFGSYQTDFIFVLKKNFYNIPGHPWNLNASLSYSYFHKTNLHGVNAYFSSPLTDGTIRPRGNLLATFSNEYFLWQKGTFTLNFAIDWTYEHIFKSEFKGILDDTLPRRKRKYCTPSQDIFNVLPALEFVFGDHFAFYLGAYFTLLGRNTSSFAQGVFSVAGTF